MSASTGGGAAPERRHRVVIVGGGFGGLRVARTLGTLDRVELTLVDRRNFHLFQPLLYQVATGGLSPGDISSPLRGVLKAQRNARVIHAEVVDLDLPGRRVMLAGGGELEWDTLVVAAGARPDYFGHDDWAAHAPGLKTIEDAQRLRNRILGAFERAETTGDEEERRRLLGFVLVGAGPTGVELAGAIGELARHTLAREFRRFDPASARVLLVEADGEVLPGYPGDLRRKARASLERLGVEVRTGSMVSAIDGRGVTIGEGEGASRVEAASVFWTAGVAPVPLAVRLADLAGIETDRQGRLPVEPDCSLRGFSDVFVIGDMARFPGGDGEPLPGVAAVAMQQGRYVGRLVRERLAGRAAGPFRYRNKGSLAVIGRAAAVADLGRLHVSGFVAWLLWVFVHIMYLIGFENRVLVATQWAFSYVTRNRGARIILAADRGQV